MQDSFHHEDARTRERCLMYDKLPFPRITSTNAEEQVKELVDYMIQFKEALEFELTSIVEENEKLKQKLNSIPRPEEE